MLKHLVDKSTLGHKIMVLDRRTAVEYLFVLESRSTMTISDEAKSLQQAIRARQHSLHQLRMMLQSLDRNEQFDALLCIFAKNVDVDSYSDQEVAGRLLVDVMPECRQSLEAILEVVAPTWNASVEQLPLYLGQVFGHETVVATASALSQNWLANDRRAEAMKTIAWWLENRRAERQAKIRTNNPIDRSGGSAAS